MIKRFYLFILKEFNYIERNLTDVYIPWNNIHIKKFDRLPRMRTHPFLLCISVYCGHSQGAFDLLKCWSLNLILSINKMCLFLKYWNLYLINILCNAWNCLYFIYTLYNIIRSGIINKSFWYYFYQKKLIKLTLLI